MDRIVEIAVLRLRHDGTVEDEFETLVNPRRDVGPTEIHHITATDVMLAPAFDEVAVDIGQRLQGAVIVGHNVRFDLGFLESEFGRVDIALPELPRLCTLRLAHQFLPTPKRRLCDCCAALGIELRQEHSALGDARATARLLEALIEAAGQEGIHDLGQLGCSPLLLPPQWVWGRPSQRCCTRQDATRTAAEARGYLPRLVRRLAGNDATNADEAEYMAVLDQRSKTGT